MTNTRDKLNEARFFLEEMRKASSDCDAFRYRLTAFLAASRSITQVMQKEFSETPGFSDWYSQKQTEMRNNPILKYLHAQRELTYHQRPMLPYPIGVTEQITEGKRTNIVLTGTGDTLQHAASIFMNLPRVQPVLNVKYYFSDFADGEKDVITICREAVNALEEIVTECESRFSADASGTSLDYNCSVEHLGRCRIRIHDKSP